VSQVNLLPREILQRQRLRRLSYLIGVGAAALVALIFLFYLVQVGTLGSVQEEIDQQERTNQAIQAQIQTLQEFEDLQAEAQRKQELLDAAFAGEMSFSGVLTDVSRLIPGTAFLNDMTIQTAAPAQPTDPAVPAATQTFVGAISFGGTSTDYDTVADLLTRLERVEGWVNPWVQSAADAEGTGVTFTTGVDLSEDVLTERGRGVTIGG
jgi:Tfp pilus assembly protein PilN